MSFQTCPICTHDKFQPIYTIDNCPIYHVLPPEMENLPTDFVSIELVTCEGCGHVFNQSFDPSIGQRLYATSMATNMKVNALMSQSEISLAADILSHSSAPKPRILEVGGGGADLSRALCKEAQHVWLVDPSPGLKDISFPEENLHVINSEFPLNDTEERFDFLIAKQVLEHIEDPVQFLRHLKKVIAENGRMYLEVPSLEYILKHASLQDVHFAHVHYYSENIIQFIAQKAGFQVIQHEDIKDGHDRFYILKPVISGTVLLRPHIFNSEEIRSNMVLTKERAISSLSECKGSLAFYGAGAYSQSMIGAFSGFENLEHVFDDTPDFAGLKVPTLNGLVPISAPDVGYLSNIDTIVITAYLHDEAISKKLISMGYQGNIYSIRNDKLAGTKGFPRSIFQ